MPQADASFDCDLFVVGGGSGGVRAARMAASLGARVVLCEEKALGGTCVNVGCIPKKLLVYGAHFSDECRDARGFGWRGEAPTHDWPALIAAKDREIARLNGVYAKLLEGRGVTVLPGRGALEGPHEVSVTSPSGERRVVRARYVLVAVGGRPIRLGVPGAEHVYISDDLFHLREMPKRVLVVGGGYIAVEFAGIFHGFGASVVQIHRGPLFLRGFDRTVRRHLADMMIHQGIDLRFDRDLLEIAKLPTGELRAVLSDGSELVVDAVVAAIGREPLTQGIGLREVGVALDARGAIRVDARYRTSVPSIYAVGDVIDRVQLTPVALAEGTIVARRLFAAADQQPDYDLVPSAVFSSPPIGTVGATEEEARGAVGAIDVYQSVFTPLKLCLSERKEKTLMKIVVDRASQRVLGMHMVGPDAGEIIQGFAVALRCGVTKAQLDATIGIHPTAAEEFVTMREPLPEADPTERAAPEAPRGRIVHHEWDDPASP